MRPLLEAQWGLIHLRGSRSTRRCSSWSASLWIGLSTCICFAQVEDKTVNEQRVIASVNDALLVERQREHLGLAVTT